MLSTMQNRKQKTMWIKEWREARGLSQQQLADAIGRDKSVISRLERGQSGLTGANLEGIAKRLGIHPGALYESPPAGTRPILDGEAQVGRVFVKPEPEQPRTTATGFIPNGLVGDRPDLPIYAAAQGGSTGMIIDFENPIDWAKRPEPLFNVKSGFGMYVVGDSMEPAYRQGDMILVHPHKPANKGDDVLVVKADGNGKHEALVKALVSMDDNTVRLKQWNPASEFSIHRGQIFGVYVIVGKYHRR